MRNKYSRVSVISEYISCSGDRVHEILEPRFDGSRIQLTVVGSEDIQDRINSYAPYTDIFYMLNRLKVGDTSVLSCNRPMYGDFSSMPDNPIDAINMVHSAERAFNRLSAEEKGNYNNDYRVWLASLFNPSDTPEKPLPDEPVPDIAVGGKTTDES